MVHKYGILSVVLLVFSGVIYTLKHVLHCSILYYALLVFIALAFSFACMAFCNIRSVNLVVSKIRIKVELNPVLFLGLVTLLYCAIFTILPICKYNSFSLSMYDFGLMDQAIWNTAHGHLLEGTNMEPPYQNLTRLSGHVEFVYLAIALVYKIIADPRILFVIQTLCVSAGIVLAFSIARIVLTDSFKAMLVAIVTALFPNLQFMTLFDFHGGVLSIPFFLLSYLGYLKKQYGLFWVSLMIALFCKEYDALAAIGFGIALIVFHKDFKRGIAVSLISLLYFVFVSYVVIPFFNNGHESALAGLNYKAIGGEHGLVGMFIYAIRHPVNFVSTMFTMKNFESLFYLFYPVAFLSFLSPVFLLGGCLIFCKDLLHGMDIGNHRLAAAVPFIIISFIYGIKRFDDLLKNKKEMLTKEGSSFVFIAVIVSSVIASFCYGPSPLGHQFWRGKAMYMVSDHDRACKAVIQCIPPQARISVSDNLAPHLAHRLYCYVFPRPMTPVNRSLAMVEYVCIDSLNKFSHGWDDTSFASQTFPELIKLGYEKIMEQDAVFLFKKSIFMADAKSGNNSNRY